MGQWRSKRGFVSDGMADILGRAFKEIGELQGGNLWQDGKKETVVPEPRLVDLADAIEFCSFGTLTVEFHPDAAGLEETKVSDLGSSGLCCGDFETIPNRGQIQYKDCSA